jgi:tRNA threonylcarbamoyl adenosine modification protein YjeE
MLNSYLSGSIQETEKIAESLVPQISKTKIVTLKGNLGSGKTLICQKIIRCLCQEEGLIVTSPTFNILKTYPSPLGTLYHYDLYRLKHFAEIEEIGLLDVINRKSEICLIEWPEIIEHVLPQDITNILIELLEHAQRKIIVS